MPETTLGASPPEALTKVQHTFRPFNPTTDGSKLAICICNNHPYMPDTFFWTFQRMMRPANSRIYKGEASTKCGSLNEASAKALQSGAEWLFFMDIDMTFPPDALKRLLSHGLPLVSGLYHTGSIPHAPVAGWAKADPEVESGYRYVNQRGNTWRYDYAPFPKGLTQVDWVGAGCLLLHRDVAVDIGWPLWRDEHRPHLGQRVLGHDVNLCLRAAAKGYKTMVDSDVNCGHWRMHEVDSNYAEALFSSDFAQKVLDIQDRDAKEQRYWDQLWLREHMLSAKRAPFYAVEHDIMLNLIPESSSLIDFGSGPGEFLELARARRNCTCTGLDFSVEAVELLKRRGFNAIRADFRVYETNGGAQSYDCAIANHSLEHVEDDDKLIRMMTEHVRPGGLIIVSVPAQETPESTDATHEHVRDYDASSLSQLLARHLSEVEVSRHGHSLVGFGRRPMGDASPDSTNSAMQSAFGRKAALQLIPNQET